MRIAAALARFHAAWWDDPRLGRSVGTWLDADAMGPRMQGFAGVLERFADRVVDVPVAGRIPRDVDTDQDYRALLAEQANA